MSTVMRYLAPATARPIPKSILLTLYIPAQSVSTNPAMLMQKEQGASTLNRTVPQLHADFAV